MKKSIISMMLIGMMMLGTTSSFGTPKNTHFQSPKTEQVVNHKQGKSDKDCNCKTCMELQKKHQHKKHTNHCTCKFQTCSPEHQNNGECVKNCQKQNKSGQTCKIQQNVHHNTNHIK